MLPGGLTNVRNVALASPKAQRGTSRLAKKLMDGVELGHASWSWLLPGPYLGWRDATTAASHLWRIVMPVYDFRLRFNLAEGYRIGSDAEELDLLVLPLGERVRMRSAAAGKPIKDCNRVAVLGGSFASPEQAREAAGKAKGALLYWAVDQRVGIDFGDGKQRSGFTQAGLAMLRDQHGCPVRNDVHGIDIYEHVRRLKFASVDAEATVGKDPPRLVDTFRREYLHRRALTEKQVLASEVYVSSFFDASPRSRFITLVTAVEALLEPLRLSEEVQALVDELKAKTQQFTMDQPGKDSIARRLESLRHQSIGQAGRTLAQRLIPDEVIDGQSSADFFSRSYGLRSQILHRGALEGEEVDVWHLANVTEAFVARLLLAALNGGSQQGVVGDAVDRE